MNSRSVISLGGGRNGHARNGQPGSNASPQATPSAAPIDKPPEPPTPIAIIGMAGRFPGADDVSGLDSLIGADVESVTKTEVLDLTTLGLALDNLEGMTFGPRLADGRRSLLIVSDNNFTPGQVSQFLLFAVR